jgi:hypothetical protein
MLRTAHPPYGKSASSWSVCILLHLHSTENTWKVAESLLPIGFPSTAEVVNAGRALHMLLNKDEISALKKKSEAKEAQSPLGKTTDFAGVMKKQAAREEACGILAPLFLRVCLLESWVLRSERVQHWRR